MTIETALEDETYDPFAAFDAALGSDTVRNPYPTFAERRGEHVIEGGTWGLFHEEHRMEAMPYQNVPVFTALSYDAVSQVLRSSGRPFSSSAYADSMGIVMGHSILEMDEPEHTSHRALLEGVFGRRAMEQWERDVITPTIDFFISKFADRGHADLVREFTFPFPVHVITGLLGLPEEDLPQFHRLAVELINIAGNPERGIKSSQKLGAYFIEIIEERRNERREDMISVLAHAELDGTRLDNEQICAFLRLLLPAGAETTYRSSSNLLFGLLTHPDQLDAVRSDRSLLPQAIEEGLRWETPLTSIVRRAMEDTELCGVTIPAGSAIMVCTGSANHDETRWEEPEEFNIFRKRFPPVAFGFGPHVCLGQHLARMETAVALNALFDRLPNLRLDPDAVDPHITGLMFRSPVSLPVLFG
ncbi:MAG: cytochrome P450 [Dehalococcoidia bacterium]